MTTETGMWFAERDVVGDRLASLAGSADTAEFPFVVPHDTPAGEVIGEFVERCLADERVVTAALEARGLRVVASSGTAAAILIAVIALTTKSVSMPGVAIGLLASGVSGLLVSAALAIVCASPRRSADIDPASIEIKLSDQFWRAKSELARRSVARSQLKVWASARLLNSRLSWWLRLAIVVYVLGLVFLSLGALVLVIR